MKYIKTAEMAACSEGFHYEDNFDATLVIFCSYRYDRKPSEVVNRIATDEKILLRMPLV